MSIRLLDLLPRPEGPKFRESKGAFLLTPTPWVAPLAVLHTIFKPQPLDVIQSASEALELPRHLTDFFAVQNGAVLFNGALAIFGVHAEGQLLFRDDPEFDMPYNIADYIHRTPPGRGELMGIGSYSADGSG